MEQQKIHKEKMESCLTLVRRFYGDEKKEVQTFVEDHPTEDKNRLTSKILAQMMTECTKEIK